jgi:hypothetical protein
MPIMESSLNSTVLQGMKHWLITYTQNQHSIPDVETAIISHRKGIHSKAISEEIMATVSLTMNVYLW